MTHLRYICVTNYIKDICLPISFPKKKADGHRISRQGPKFVSVKKKKESLVIVISRVMMVAPRLTPVMTPVFAWRHKGAGQKMIEVENEKWTDCSMGGPKMS